MYMPNRVDGDEKCFANLTLSTRVVGLTTISTLTMLGTDTNHCCLGVMVIRTMHIRPNRNALPLQTGNVYTQQS